MINKSKKKGRRFFYNVAGLLKNGMEKNEHDGDDDCKAKQHEQGTAFGREPPLLPAVDGVDAKEEDGHDGKKEDPQFGHSQPTDACFRLC